MIDFRAREHRLVSARAALLPKMRNCTATERDHTELDAIEAELEQLRTPGKRTR